MANKSGWEYCECGCHNHETYVGGKLYVLSQYGDYDEKRQQFANIWVYPYGRGEDSKKFDSWDEADEWVYQKKVECLKKMASELGFKIVAEPVESINNGAGI